MPLYYSDDNVRGLHILAVLTAARELVSSLVTNGGAETLAPLITAELDKLAHEANRLAQFERECAARGTLKAPEPKFIAQILSDAETVRSLTADERDTQNMDDTQVHEAFAPGGLFAPDAVAEARPADAEEAIEEDPFWLSLEFRKEAE
jgi:hypothetical protein